MEKPPTLIDPSALQLHPRTLELNTRPRAISDLLFMFDALKKSDDKKSAIIANLHAQIKDLTRAK